jgi:phenylpropionate dioxygenase-like ring-hydroxylating dioxygenase large terminal subunit
MLNEQDNRLVTKTGPGTPMGEYMRRFWLPALLSRELPSPDCPPIRLKLLSENLIGFRTTSGQAALIQNACPHRGASLFFGRNEEEGLRCVYHGWKFDVEGNCVDMPSEPAESNFKSKVKATAYPVVERAGLIWTYMGPIDHKPDLPNYEWTLVPDDQVRVSRRLQECNFLQGVEGGIDSSHVPFLHGQNWGATPAPTNYNARDKAPRLMAEKTDYGFVYGAQRNGEADSNYWRITPFMLPFFTVIPGGLETEPDKTYSGHGWVPADDENCWMVTYSWNNSRPLRNGEGHPAHDVAIDERSLRPTLQNADNDYGIDREVQRTQTFTGISNGSIQDAAIQETMGAIFDRTKEHLGTTDLAIITLRRIYLEGARQLLEGKEPVMPEPAAYRKRSVSALLDKNWTFTHSLAFFNDRQQPPMISTAVG